MRNHSYILAFKTEAALILFLNRFPEARQKLIDIISPVPVTISTEMKIESKASEYGGNLKPAAVYGGLTGLILALILLLKLGLQLPIQLSNHPDMPWIAWFPFVFVLIILFSGLSVMVVFILKLNQSKHDDFSVEGNYGDKIIVFFDDSDGLDHIHDAEAEFEVVNFDFQKKIQQNE